MKTKKRLWALDRFNEDTFVRFVTINATNKKEDILNFFKVLENFVENNLSLVETESENAV